MQRKHDSEFVNGWLRDFVSVRVSLHSLRKRLLESRYNTKKVDWRGQCVERAIAVLMEPEPPPEPKPAKPRKPRKSRK